MCLSTVYDVSAGQTGQERVVMEFVSQISVEGKQITLTDVMGARKTVSGEVLGADLTGGVVRIREDHKTADYSSLPCSAFVEVLASKSPVPGGGGASALVGAVGTALGNMVGSLTVGKKKYADVEAEMISLKAECDTLQKELLSLVEQDAAVFEPLARAYRMPHETEAEKTEKERTMQSALKDACDVPLKIMEKCCEAVDLIREFASKGSVLAVSDAGVGAAFCKAAVQGASLNVLINTKSMSDRRMAEAYNARVLEMLEKYIPAADEIFRSVSEKLQQ